MSLEYKFEGWVGEDISSAAGNMIWKEYEPKTWEETDVDIKVTHSGICGTDLHTLRSGWGVTKYPCVVGHEIVGVAIRVGSNVTNNIRVGDVVGVGAQNDSCLNRDSHCEFCSSNLEQYCPGIVNTYDAIHRNGSKSYGGHALYHRCPSHFVIKIPHGLASEFAAPMLCGGIAVYSPLKTFGAGPGKRVGIIGIGGLGHFAVLFAKALGCREVVGISRKAKKQEEAISLGCDEYIATDNDMNWAKKNKDRFDLIISTVSSERAPYNDYLHLLKFDGTLVQVGAPEALISVHPIPLIIGRKRIAGSVIGSPSEIAEMLQLAVDRQVKPWIQKRPMSDANQAMVDFVEGRPRFRYVLINDW